MTGSVTGIRRRRTVAGRRETSHLPPDRAFYGQTLSSDRLRRLGFASGDTEDAATDAHVLHHAPVGVLLAVLEPLCAS